MKLGIFAIAVLCPIFALGEEWNLGEAKQEIIDLKRRIEAVESFQKKVEANWDLGCPEKCPCPDGKCICPADKCDCPNCPIHKKNSVVPSGLENQDNEIEFYGVSWKGTEPTGVGRELALFGTSWCINCPAAYKRLGPYTKQTYYIAEDNPLRLKYGVNSYPYLVALQDGEIVERTSGDSVGAYLAGKWLNLSTSTKEVEKPVPSYGSSRYVVRYSGPSWDVEGYSPNVQNLLSHIPEHREYKGEDLSGFSFSELKTIHDNLHNAGRSGITSGVRSSTVVTRQPARKTNTVWVNSRPSYSYGFNYGQRTYSTCPNCVR